MNSKASSQRFGGYSNPKASSRASAGQESAKCTHCRASGCCLGDGLSAEQFAGFERLAQERGPYQAGQTLFKMEDEFNSVFIVQYGSVKIEAVSHNGTNLVDDFFFQGDMVGLEAIGDSHYRHDAVALETTRVCELPFDQLESFALFAPRLQHKILNHLAYKIRRVNESIVHGRYLSAEQRLLSFLTGLCQSKVIKRDSNSGTLHLSMSKADIASYLGLRPESLSRALGRLQSSGVIRNHAKKIDFLDIDALLEMVCK